jgi:hypothetical protein
MREKGIGRDGIFDLILYIRVVCVVACDGKYRGVVYTVGV